MTSLTCTLRLEKGCFQKKKKNKGERERIGETFIYNYARKLSLIKQNFHMQAY